MKRIFFAFIVLAVTTGIFNSCKKQSDPTLEDKISGKWTMNTAIGVYTVMGVTTTDTTSFTAEDYFEFKADSILLIRETGQEYEGKWKISNNKLFISETGYMDYTGGFEIRQLTGKSLQLYYAEGGQYPMEQTLNLSR